jgi:hypothetical protein
MSQWSFMDTEERRRAFIAGWRARQAQIGVEVAGEPASRTPEELAEQYASTPVRASPRLLAALGYDAPHAGVMGPDDEGAEIDF